uniref:Uncharacterized protein n=1 Tax=Rhizophora mucronata TaxID=61149 RepID=A0A2P2NNZ9_RHIMU
MVAESFAEFHCNMP